ncbi:MAG TPA: tripartite tricarboxylate transporter substrate-binding protein [Burkholderiales bacterium]|nr:tripartite tricarboxylate transporter substrate-binding protein [Burkholderiales bacterium]
MRTVSQRLPFSCVAVVISGAVGLPATSGIAQTTPSYPTRPVRMIIPFTAGSATDLLARRIALRMTENWGQQVVVDNRPGGGGTLATGIVAKATTDGVRRSTNTGSS